MLPFVTMYVPNRYKTQKMRYKIVIGKSGILRGTPHCYKDKQMCDNAIDN